MSRGDLRAGDKLFLKNSLAEWLSSFELSEYPFSKLIQNIEIKYIIYYSFL